MATDATTAANFKKTRILIESDLLTFPRRSVIKIIIEAPGWHGPSFTRGPTMRTASHIANALSALLDRSYRQGMATSDVCGYGWVERAFTGSNASIRPIKLG